jgi:hypothetical protein
MGADNIFGTRWPNSQLLQFSPKTNYIALTLEETMTISYGNGRHFAMWAEKLIQIVIILAYIALTSFYEIKIDFRLLSVTTIRNKLIKKSGVLV